MPYRDAPTDLPMITFDSSNDFEAFLEAENGSAKGVYLKIAKKSSSARSITSEAAVEVALCFGWIDGWGCGLDDQWYCKKFTPRRAKSVWSQKNVDTVSRLIETGRMRPTGAAAVEAAKADGRWERTYGGSAGQEVPEDLASELSTDLIASANFESMNKTGRYAALWRIKTASPSNRPKRIEKLMQSLRQSTRSGSEEKSKEEEATKTQLKRKREIAPGEGFISTTIGTVDQISSVPREPNRALSSRRKGLRPWK